MKFTERQREILELLSYGYTDAQIAETLELSVRTVRFHVQKMYAILGKHSRTAIVARALRHGIIS